MTRGDRARGVAALTVAALLLVTCFGATAQAAGIDFGRCTAAKRDRSRCGRVTVPLDRGGTLPGSVSLKVRVLPPRTGTANGTIFALAGGPGQAATPLVSGIAAALGPVARSRRVVTFDQRGTGGSGRLRCKALGRADATTLTRAVADCATQLGPRRAAYTTAASVEDLEAVRAALGVERIVVFGVSYGTKVALDYAARYPQHVSRLVLDSVVLPEGVDPFMRSTLTAVPRVLSQLCAGRSACSYTRDPGSDLARLIAKIDRGGALRGTRFDGRGRARRVSITREQLLGLLMQGDFDPFSRIGVPAAVRSALAGDTAPLAKLVAVPETGLDDAGGDSDALFVATSCEDGGVPWPTGTPIDARPQAFRTMLAQLPAASLAPFDRETLRRSGIDYCNGWPEAPIAQPSAPLPDVPTLILSGDDDLRTPRKDAVELARRIPSAELVTVPETGHSVLTSDLLGCAEAALVRFFQNKAARDCSLELPRAFQPSPQLPRTLAQVPAARGVPGRAGRTLTAAGVTLLGFSEELLTQTFLALMSGDEERDALAFGGLRGGSARIDERAFAVDRYSVVGGVTMSFRITRANGDEPLVVRIGGRAAARGTLRIDRRVVGRLGGRAVDVSVDAFLSPRATTSAVGGGVVPAAFPTAARLLAQRERALRAAAALRPLGAATAALPGLGGAR